MVEPTLDRIVNLAGEWTDDSRSSREFRSILEDEQTPTEDIESYLNEAIQGGKSYHNQALQDIVEGVIELFSHCDNRASWVVFTFIISDCNNEAKAQREEHLRSCVDAASGMRSTEATVLD